MISKFIDFFKRPEKKIEPVKISKDFNIDEFNDWFKNEFDDNRTRF